MAELISVDEAAQQLQLQPRTVRGYIRSGKLRASRIGKQYRIRIEDLELLTAGGATAVACVPNTRGGQVDANATVVLDIESATSDLAGRVAQIANSVGFASGVRMNVMAGPDSHALKIVVTGPLSHTLQVLVSIQNLLEVTHDH